MGDPPEENRSDQPENDRQNPSAGALESAERHIARSADTSSSCDGSGAAFTATFSALVEWGQERDLIRKQSDFEFFARATDGHGDEHEAWYDAESKRWYKATYLNRFGLAWGRDDTATVHEYLLRLLLQNMYFGDDIHLVALISHEERMRVLISQPHIAGSPAKYDLTQRWFTELGFQKIESDSIAWYYEPANLLVADAHEGNVIQTAVGTLVPIDLNIIQPKGLLLSGIQLELYGQAQPMLPGF